MTDFQRETDNNPPDTRVPSEAPGLRTQKTNTGRNSWPNRPDIPTQEDQTSDAGPEGRIHPRSHGIFRTIPTILKPPPPSRHPLPPNIPPRIGTEVDGFTLKPTNRGRDTAKPKLDLLQGHHDRVVSFKAGSVRAQMRGGECSAFSSCTVEPL